MKSAPEVGTYSQFKFKLYVPLAVTADDNSLITYLRILYSWGDITRFSL